MGLAATRPEPSWSEQYRARKEIERRFGKIHALPVVKRLRDLLAQQVAPGAAVLEVGAGGREMGHHLEAVRPGVRYRSCDPDPSGAHDFARLEDVPGAFAVVFAFEVVEHVPLPDLGPFLARLAARLEPGGRLLLSTPNVYYPPDVLRDATHVTPLCYDELGGLVERAGLRVTRLVRIYHDPFLRTLARRYLFGWLFRLLGLDFAHQIALVAERPPQA